MQAMARALGRRSRTAVGAAAVACGLLSAAAALAADAVAPGAVLLVKPGDSFSALAAQVTGNPRDWRRLYRPGLSGLPDPSQLAPGARLQLVADGRGGQYLKLLPPGAAAAPALATRNPATATRATTPAQATVAASGAAPGLTSGMTSGHLPAAASSPAAAAHHKTMAPRRAPPSPLDQGLVLGVLPNIDPALLVQRYDLMRRYLERAGAARHVRVVVPANFQAFFEATLRGDFDLAVAAPHLARLAQLDRGLVPLLSYEPRIDALLLAPVDSALVSAADMAGQPVAFANPQSLVALYGLQWFERQGLVPNRHFQVKAARSDLGVGRMVLVGEAAAAVMSQGEFRALPAEERGRLRIVAALASMPNFIVLAHPRLTAARQDQLRQLLKSFMADSAEGAEFARETGLSAIVDTNAQTLSELDPFVAATRHTMGR